MLNKSAGLFCALALSFATVAYAQTDAALTTSVKTKLAAEESIKASNVNVTTIDHVVTLKGTVGSKAEKDRVLAIARGTTGVASVVDLITVGDAPTGTGGKTVAEKAASGVEKGADKSADAVGTAANKTAGAVDKSKSNVGAAAEKTGDAIGTAAKATGEAVVTGAKATGEAVGTAAKKTGEAVGVGADKTKEATEKAGDKTGAAVSDATITAGVKSKLLGDGKTPGLKIDVDTVDGVVTLRGDVPTAAAHLEALRLARSTNGVKSVVDKMTVAGK